MTQTRALLDLSQLMGFEAAPTIRPVDFRDDATASRVGAKMGGEPPAPALDNVRLFGFEATAGTPDFADPAMAARVGAKVGGIGEPTAPALDNSRLFGFETMAGTPDFADAAMAARVGAKVAPGEPTIESTVLDVTRLLGFETADLAAAGYRGNSIGAAVLEPDVTSDGVGISAHLGAKMGEPAIMPEGVGIAAHLGAKLGEPQVTTDGIGIAPHLGAKLGEPGILSN